MRTARRIIPFLLSALVVSCDLKLTEPSTPLEKVAAVYLASNPDTLFLSVSSTQAEQWAGKLEGIVLNVSQRVISNTGFSTKAEFTVTLVDSVRKPLDETRATWQTDHPEVVTVTANRITAKLPGSARVWAIYNGVTSDRLVIVVRPTTEAPGLYVAPPEFVLTFQNSVGVSGVVQTQFNTARLTIADQAGVLPVQALTYASSGSFSTVVTGIPTGFNRLIIRAAHQSISTLFTQRTKVVCYYPINSPEADSIVGRWRGTLGDRILDFRVSRSAFPGRYDISGTVDIRFPGYGVIQDVALPGLVSPDGSLAASLTRTYDKFTVTGTLKGLFRTTGSADGSLSAVAKRSGWADLGAKESWRANRIGE